MRSQLSESCHLNVIPLIRGISAILGVTASDLSVAAATHGSSAREVDSLPLSSLGRHYFRAGEMTEFLAFGGKIVSGVRTTWDIGAQALDNFNS
jgi:hypothetical protein